MGSMYKQGGVTGGIGNMDEIDKGYYKFTQKNQREYEGDMQKQQKQQEQQEQANMSYPDRKKKVRNTINVCFGGYKGKEVPGRVGSKSLAHIIAHKMKVDETIIIKNEILTREMTCIDLFYDAIKDLKELYRCSEYIKSKEGDRDNNMILEMFEHFRYLVSSGEQNNIDFVAESIIAVTNFLRWYGIGKTESRLL